MLYALANFFVIPKIAEASLPYKWKNIVTGLKRDNYAFYLGTPATNETSNPDRDIWISRNGNYTFSLEVHYKDSIAETVLLSYSFSNYLFHKEGIIQKEKE